MAAPFPAVIALRDLDGMDGFVIGGVEDQDQVGRTVSDAGDVNGDGIDDIIIGAFNQRRLSGQSYVVFGRRSNPQASDASLDLDSLDGGDGFRIFDSRIRPHFSVSVSGAGDLNGDGFDDVVVGSELARPDGINTTGQAFVIYGRDGSGGTTPFSAAFDTSTIDGVNGFEINGLGAGDLLGREVSGAGDLNGDGIDDLLIGASEADANGNADSGKTYVIFGRDMKSGSQGFGASFDLTSLDGTNGFVIDGKDAGDRSGFNLSGAGDINGDGIDDLLVSALGASDEGTTIAWEAYAVFGRNVAGGSTSFSPTLKLSDLDGGNGFVMTGDSQQFFNLAVSGAGDINGDGLDDIVIGAPDTLSEGGSRSGESYVVFGQNTTGGVDRFAAMIDLTTLDGSNGFVITSASEGDRNGRSVSGIGDVNGDGIDDLLIGASDADGFPGFSNGGTSFRFLAGASFVVFGRDTLNEAGFDASLSLADLDGTNGFAMVGADAFDITGLSVSGAGDFNGDGVNDLLIGAPFVPSQIDPFADIPQTGKAYVVFGRLTVPEPNSGLLGLAGWFTGLLNRRREPV